MLQLRRQWEHTMQRHCLSREGSGNTRGKGGDKVARRQKARGSVLPLRRRAGTFRPARLGSSSPRLKGSDERRWKVKERQWKGQGKAVERSRKGSEGSGKVKERQWRGQWKGQWKAVGRSMKGSGHGKTATNSYRRTRRSPGRHLCCI